MDHQLDERYLLALAALEIAFLAGIFVIIAANAFGDGSLAAATSQPVLFVALAFVGVELLIPLYVVWDLRRSPEAMDPLWIHAVLTPVVNVFGLMAYRWKRQQVREAASAGGEGDDST